MKQHILDYGVKERVILHPRVTEIREGAEINETKLDLMALTTIFIEEIWSGVAQEYRADTSAGLLKIAQMDEITLLSATTTAEDTIESLKSCVEKIIQPHTAQWREQRENTNVRDSNTHLYPAFKILLKKYRPERTVDGYMLRGFNTAIQTIFNVFRVIPKVYQCKFHTAISAAELRTIMRESKKLILLLSYMSLNGFVALQKILTATETQVYRQDYSAKDFAITSTGGKLALALDPILIAQLKDTLLELSPLTTGCPALPIIGEFFALAYDLAEAYYIPKFT